MKLFLSVFNFFILILFFLNASHANESGISAEYTIKNVVITDINSTINPSIYHYLQKVQKKYRDADTLLVIKINTPGGLVTTTKDILNLFGKSLNPVVVWVTPEGASATSAGAIIAAGAHFIFMSQGTNIGAATPITMSGDIPGEKKAIDEKNKEKLNPEGGDLRAKAINDLVALVSSLSEARGRPAKEFALMITEAKSFSAQEALDKKMINAISNNLSDILKQVNGSEIKMQGETKTLRLADGNTIIDEEMDWGDQILNIFGHPQTAYILFILGAALLYFEFQAPGGFIAGSVGVLCLVLAAIGFQVLPVNYAGIGLLVLSGLFFIIDVYVTSYGILTLLGLVALFFGSTILYETNDSLLSLGARLIWMTMISAVLLVLSFAFYFYRSSKNKKENVFFDIVGFQGQVLKELEPFENGFFYHVKVQGSIWKGFSSERLSPNEFITVTEKTNHNYYLIKRK
jgi:membrane-bound serine protease (ClpP class)